MSITSSSSRSPRASVNDLLLADPNSYFDVDISSARRASGAGHRPSKSSSDSREFDFFNSCLTARDHPEEPWTNISTADELFYKGKLLPLYMSQRLQMLDSNLDQLPEVDHNTSISFSCYLHKSDLDIKVVESQSDESRNSSRDDSRNSSRDSSISEESPTSSLRFNSKLHQKKAPEEQQVHSGRFRWGLLLPQKKSNSKTFNCPESSGSSVCTSCGHRKSEADLLQRPSSGYEIPFSTQQNDRDQERRSSYQGLQRAKALWRRYLKPLILRNNSVPRSFVSSKSGMNHLMNLNRRPRSMANTPLASPTHSGLLSVVVQPASSSDNDVQGAIAYCKQNRAT